MVEGTEGSHHKEGSTKMSKDITVCAGIDIGKHKLDIAIDGSAERLQVDNNSEGRRSLSSWLRQRRVERIGLEASGGYEQAVVVSLRADGFVVIVFQPAQVRAYAKFVLQHAKNDAIDAVLIARCTAAATDIREPPDARLAFLAQHLTMIEQLTEDVGQLKTRREASREQRIREFWKREINRLKVLLNSELKQLVAVIREHRDLAHRLDLIASVDGVGLRTAVAILVRMPEIGRVTREQAGAIAGRLLLEPAIESLLQASPRCRKVAQACPRRLRSQAPHLRQHRRRPRYPLDAFSSHHIMVAHHEAGRERQCTKLIGNGFSVGADPSGGATASAVRASDSHGRHHRTCARDRLPRAPRRRSG